MTRPAFVSSPLGFLQPRDLELGPFKHASGDSASPWHHWLLRRDEEGIAWLLFDRKGASANTLSEAVLSELDDVLAGIERDRPRGLVIRSAKPAGFIAGADIGEFRGAADPARVADLLTRGHAVIDRLDRLPLPTVAVVHGYCLGGGLEVALACDYRIAIEGAAFAFPEVLLGLHPGLGGTVRLTRLISPMAAMPMMLTGRTQRDRAAKSLGVVDTVTQERHVRAAVRAAVAGELRRARQGLIGRLQNLRPVRGLLASRMRAETAKKVRAEHYPAPFALIDLWEKHGGDRTAMLREEIASFARLLVTDTAQNLVRVFFLREGLKSAGSDWNGWRVHVIGAGAMGGDIAAWCAWQGLTVSLADMKAEPLAAAVKRAAELYGKIARRTRETRDALDRLIPDPRGDGISRADLVIEAVPESLDLKRKIYAAVEPRMKPGAILATNTSSLPLERLREGLARPERFVGLHFFNPVSRLQLVELVGHDRASEDTMAAARAFLGRIDRLPAHVASAPGFLVNRALTPYLLEAMAMLEEGVAKESIDAAAERFGMPVGPIELADQVGLDVCLSVAATLASALGDDYPQPPQWLKDKVGRGELGRKSGRGIYDWKGGHAVKRRNAPPPPPDAADRMILPLLNACVACLREHVVEDEDTLDGAMILATGFAPFRGGPMHYARQRGVIEVRDRLNQLSQHHGPRFRPDPGWDLLV